MLNSFKSILKMPFFDHSHPAGHQGPAETFVYESVSTDLKLQQYVTKAKRQTKNVAMRKYAKLLSFLQMQAAG